MVKITRNDPVSIASLVSAAIINNGINEMILISII